jgi:hypothetical protein
MFCVRYDDTNYAPEAMFAGRSIQALSRTNSRLQVNENELLDIAMLMIMWPNLSEYLKYLNRWV